MNDSSSIFSLERWCGAYMTGVSTSSRATIPGLFVGLGPLARDSSRPTGRATSGCVRYGHIVRTDSSTECTARRSFPTRPMQLRYERGSSIGQWRNHSSIGRPRHHVSLGKDEPYTRAIERFGDVAAHPILGGLHHRYARIWFLETTVIAFQQGYR
jgi:hypothetical protein